MTASDRLARLGDAQGLDELTHVVSRAAAAILAIDRSTLAWRTKPDRSPVTAADEAANAVILEALSRLLPGVPVVSEEDHAQPAALEAGFVLVDPLDGTREYLAGRDEFTVNLAVIGKGKPASSGSLPRRPSAASGAASRAAAPSASNSPPGRRRTRPR
jgi:3'(2'), 5'-bisphosphate nucleotidase